jgi:hypothetical protein
MYFYDIGGSLRDGMTKQYSGVQGIESIYRNQTIAYGDRSLKESDITWKCRVAVKPTDKIPAVINACGVRECQTDYVHICVMFVGHHRDG